MQHTVPMAPAAFGVATWNVQNASPQRAVQQMAWLVSQAHSQIVVLTEVPRTHRAHAAALAAAGYEIVVGPARIDYGVLIASRLGGLKERRARGAQLEPRFVSAVARTPIGSLEVVGLYVPSRGPQARRNVAKRAFQAKIATWLAQVAVRSKRPYVIAGDLNVVEPGHMPHHRVFGKWEYDFYRAFGTAGAIDLFREQHPALTAHSWFGRSGRGFRFDHIFGSSHIAALRSECWYDQAPRLEGLSDHAAMFLALDPSLASMNLAQVRG